jgi:hypothetical protein
MLLIKEKKEIHSSSSKKERHTPLKYLNKEMSQKLSMNIKKEIISES